MKSMGFSALTLVAPKVFPAAAATARASGADDVLAGASVTESLEAAVEDCVMVFGTTARARHLRWPVLSPAEAAEQIRGATAEGPVAVVFGREQSGLSNAQLDWCQRAIRIPTVDDFNSLNLAQAVQVCVYEVRKALLSMQAEPKDGIGTCDRAATAAELARLHRHLLETMNLVGYFDPSNPRLLERRIWRLLNRTRLLRSESQILRGFLAAVGRTIRHRAVTPDDGEAPSP